MLRFFANLALCVFILDASAAVAQDVRLTPEKSVSTFQINGKEFSVSRIQDTENRLTGDFTKTSRACPPFCIQPISVADGVETIGELEVIRFLETEVAGGTGILMDSRVPEFYANGAIPGAINVPFSTLDPSNPYINDIMQALGATVQGDTVDFSGVFTLALYCNGPWCEQSPRAIRNLIAAGYPAEKILYYRGGMQSWLQLGLSTDIPGTGG